MPMILRRLKYDFKLLKGDPMLYMIMAVPFILWALMQFLVPWIIELSMQNWDLDLSAHYKQAGTFFLMLIPMMIGMVYGFILLDERDGGIITAISVTPTGKLGYLSMRLGVPIVLSLVAILLFQLVLGLRDKLDIIQLIVISVLVSSQSLLLLLLLGAFADNKVMGMALSKGFGILLIGPLLDYILPGTLKWTGAYSPLFWASRALMANSNGHFWLYTSITIVFQSLLLWFLFSKFRARSD